MSAINAGMPLWGATASQSASALSPTPGQPGAPSFSDMLSNALQSTSNAEWKAQDAMSQAVTGQDVSEVELMTAVKKADLSLRMMLQVRNTLLQAYDEIKSMQF